MVPVLLKMLHGARKSTLPANSPAGYIPGRENVRRRCDRSAIPPCGNAGAPATAGTVAPGRRRGRAKVLQGRTNH